MTHFLGTGLGAYCIRPTNGPVRGRMNLFSIHFLNTRNPLNQKPGTCGGVCNTPLPWRIKNSIPFYPLNRPPGTCRGVCNMLLHIRIKKSIPFYLLNHLSDTFWGVYNIPLPWRIKNSIPFYLLNRPPGTCGGVCNTLLHIRIKKSIPFYLLNQELGAFRITYLYSLSTPGEKPLKFVWMNAKPAGDETNMAISM